jgi:hypothetical protein
LLYDPNDLSRPKEGRDRDTNHTSKVIKADMNNMLAEAGCALEEASVVESLIETR